jgi:hypothetical protein
VAGCRQRENTSGAFQTNTIGCHMKDHDVSSAVCMG